MTIYWPKTTIDPTITAYYDMFYGNENVILRASTINIDYDARAVSPRNMSNGFLNNNGELWIAQDANIDGGQISNSGMVGIAECTGWTIDDEWGGTLNIGGEYSQGESWEIEWDDKDITWTKETRESYCNQIDSLLSRLNANNLTSIKSELTGMLKKFYVYFTALTVILDEADGNDSWFVKLKTDLAAAKADVREVAEICGIYDSSWEDSHGDL